MLAITGVPLGTFRLGLWRLGRASFVLRVRGAPVLVVDPVLKPVPGVRVEGRPSGDAPPFPASELQGDLVLLTSARPERFDPATIDKSSIRTRAWFSGPADTATELVRMGIPAERFAEAIPGKRFDFEKLSVEVRACAPGRADASFLVTATEPGTRFYFAADPYHEVGAGGADVLAVPMSVGEGGAGAKFTAHVRPQHAVPCPLGVPDAVEPTIMEYTMELGGLELGGVGCRIDPGYPLLLGDDGQWTRVSGDLVMSWQCAKSIPDAPLPPGYKMRNWKESDVPALAAIYVHTQGPTYDEAWYRKQIMGNIYFSKDRCFVVESGGKPVATALAWEDEKVKDIGRGVLHHLATDPQHQRKGLGKAVTAAVMRYFQKDGRREVRLATTDFRARGVLSYIAMGFEPVEDTDEMKRRWANLRTGLARQASES